ncbi:efflux RND transporter permease subunit [Guggenheimella bovis]
MQKVAHFIVYRKRLVLILFIILMILSLASIPFVKINYDLLDYLPEHAPSTVAMNVLKEEFGQAIPNVRIAKENLSIVEALELKKSLEEIPEVESVLWLDDITNVKVPVSFIDADYLEMYYKDSTVMMQLTSRTDRSVETVKAIRKAIGEDGHMSGQLVENARVRQASEGEIARIMIIMIPLGLLLLMFTTRNYVEPFLLLLTIGVAISLNMGTNVAFKNISFITASVSSVLQLAVSLDYAIFLLHRYNDNLQEGDDHELAMEKAIVKSSVAVTSSALTTFLGFLALLFMQFRIGSDLGIVLAKGILFSLLTVIMLLPVLVLYLKGIVEKARHRSFLPSFKGFSNFVGRFHKAFLLIFLITIIAFLAQGKNDFLYGNDPYAKGSKEAMDRTFIDETFGRENQIVILVDKDELVKEKELVEDIKAMDHVKAVVSYTENVSVLIPEEILGKKERNQFVSNNYNRIIVFNDLESEGKESFAFEEALDKRVRESFPKAHIAGILPALYDVKDVTNKDNAIVNGLAILTIGLVILFAFKSLSIPLLLLLTIETSIWINLSVPYFTQTKLSYLGYLIISSVQLGATVDYGILFTQHYLDNRQKLLKKEALVTTLQEVIAPLVPTAFILTLAGLLLWRISSIQVVSELGEVLGRGAFLSFLNTILFLPALFALFDRLVEKTTLKISFKKEEK